MTGRGVYVSPDGASVEGYFENDNFVGPIDQWTLYIYTLRGSTSCYGNLFFMIFFQVNSNQKELYKYRFNLLILKSDFN